MSKEPTFSAEWEKVHDTEQNCWTPTKGYDDGQYYWRVAMMDGNGLHGDYSPYETFIKQYPITTLISPLNGASIYGTPTFVWSPVYGAANYKIEISLVENFSTTRDSITTPNTRFTPTEVYAIDKVYYWRVAIVDADGKLGPFTNATIILSPYPYHFHFPLIRK